MDFETRRKSSFPLYSQGLISRILSYSQVIIWWFAILIALILLIVKGVGFLYYTYYYAGFSLAAALFCYFVESNELQNQTASSIAWYTRVLIAIFVPSLFSVDLTRILINGLSQAIIDGTGAVTINMLIGLLTTTILIPAIPFLSLPRKNMVWTTLFVFKVFLVLILVAVFITPFTESAPSHIYTFSDINLQKNYENTTVRANEKIDPQLLDLVSNNYSNTSFSATKDSKYFPQMYSATWIGDNGFAARFNSSKTDMVSYNVTKNIPPEFRGSKDNTGNGMFISINAPKSYICELVTEKLPLYLYVVPQFAYNETKIFTNLEKTNQTNTVFPPNNSKFSSFSYLNVPKYYSQSLLMLSKNPNSNWVVYLEPENSGTGDITLQCYYGEISLLMPQIELIKKYYENKSPVLGSPHNEYVSGVIPSAAAGVPLIPTKRTRLEYSTVAKTALNPQEFTEVSIMHLLDNSIPKALKKACYGGSDTKIGCSWTQFSGNINAAIDYVAELSLFSKLIFF
ncbi:hypothetical protein BB561_002731 [Smittium simulii]|uniref:Uncharacterized protein n=1 Tax=Smittium simulii TaxID=133385 RepID=A0A2T9YPI8_9FUNG|nr:hypothetical protein BB561_002731 [Smittium simulii]